MRTTENKIAQSPVALNNNAPGKVPFLQPKLTINAPGDQYELEADQVAEQVMRMPINNQPFFKPSPLSISRLKRKCKDCEEEEKLQRKQDEDEEEQHIQLTPVNDLSLQRKCAHCGEEEKRLYRKASADSQMPNISPSVEQTLKSTGQPMDKSTRSFMEQRFGYDFGNVQIHNDTLAHQSSADINALAYTYGGHVVFGAGQYRPHNNSGKKLLAHELAHTIQQENTGLIRRFVPCEQASASMEKCPPREKDEIAKAKTSPMELVTSDPPFLVVNFAVNSSLIKKNLHDRPYWKKVVEILSNPNAEWKIWGISDCQGPERLNKNLRKKRATALYKILPPQAQNQILSFEEAPLSDCIYQNDSPINRTFNRSVLIEQVFRDVDFEAEEIEVEEPKFVCGPDVTKETADAVKNVKSMFAGWTPDKQEESCDALVTPWSGKISWDIVQLHFNDWIYKDYRPYLCASKNARPACGGSVQIDDECHYAGSVNYVIYGAMFKLCSDAVSDDYNPSSLHSFIDLYKGSGWSAGVVGTPSANFGPSLSWAYTGYYGWPGTSSPSGDRNNCSPKCPKSYFGPPFEVHWYPNSVKEPIS